MSQAELVVQKSPLNSEDKNFTVRCTEGKVAIGGGARILGPQGSDDWMTVPRGVALVATHPQGLTGEKPVTWTAIAREMQPVAGDWGLSVHVMCARATD